MSDWIGFQDAEAMTAVTWSISETTARMQIRAAIGAGDIDVRNWRHVNGDLSGIPTLGGNSDEDREISRRSLLRWLAKPNQTPPPPVLADDLYISPFIGMMLDAVRKFDVTATALVKKEVLEDYFRGLKLPNGSPISDAQAKYMATFCRSPDAMKGGNKRMG